MLQWQMVILLKVCWRVRILGQREKINLHRARLEGAPKNWWRQVKWWRCEKLPAACVSLGEWTLKFSAIVHAHAGLLKLTCGGGWRYTKSIDWAAGIKKEQKNESKAWKCYQSPLKRVCHWTWDALFKVHLLRAESMWVELDFRFRVCFPQCGPGGQQLSPSTSACSSFILRQLFSFWNVFRCFWRFVFCLCLNTHFKTKMTIFHKIFCWFGMIIFFIIPLLSSFPLLWIVLTALLSECPRAPISLWRGFCATKVRPVAKYFALLLKQQTKNRLACDFI